MKINDILNKENKALLSELVRTDFKLRYQGSVLGYAWSLLRPLFMFAILYVVFVKFLRIGGDVPNYPMYLLLGIVIWTFFSEMTSQSVGSIVGRGDLIRKIKIPIWLIIISTSIGALINLGFNLLVFLVFASFSHMNILITSLWLPAILFEVYLLALGLSLLLSALYVKYRDLSYIWEIFLQAGFYLTPILYPLSIITNHNFAKILLTNPLAQTIQDARASLVTNDTITIDKLYGSNLAYFIPIVIVLLTLLLGIIYFKKQADYFAENL